MLSSVEGIGRKQSNRAHPIPFLPPKHGTMKRKYLARYSANAYTLAEKRVLRRGSNMLNTMRVRVSQPRDKRWEKVAHDRR